MQLLKTKYENLHLEDEVCASVDDDGESAASTIHIPPLLLTCSVRDVGLWPLLWASCPMAFICAMAGSVEGRSNARWMEWMIAEESLTKMNGWLGYGIGG